MKLRLRWTFGTPPRPLEVSPVEKHARMAERGHGGRAAAEGLLGRLGAPPPRREALTVSDARARLGT